MTKIPPLRLIPSRQHETCFTKRTHFQSVIILRIMRRQQTVDPSAEAPFEARLVHRLIRRVQFEARRGVGLQVDLVNHLSASVH